MLSPSLSAIEVYNLTKVYHGGVLAVDDISFTVERGEIFGFLGPNGAGKSTPSIRLRSSRLPAMPPKRRRSTTASPAWRISTSRADSTT